MGFYMTKADSSMRELGIEAREEYKIYCESLGLNPKVEELCWKGVDFFKEGLEDFSVTFSSIEGKGLFTLRSYLRGEKVAVAFREESLNSIFKYINHSTKYANVVLHKIFGADVVNLIAVRPIDSGEEILIDYSCLLLEGE